MTMGSVPTEIRTGTGACPYDGWGGEGKGNGDGFCEGIMRENGERACERMVRGFARDLSDGGIGLARGLHERVWGSGRDPFVQSIRTARETNRQKAMRSPFPCRHRRSLQ